MERRVLLAISLSFLVLFVFQTYFVPPRRQRRSLRPDAGAIARTGVPAPAGHAAPANPDTGSQVAVARRVMVGETESAKSSSRPDAVRAVFTNRGAPPPALGAEGVPHDDGAAARPRARSRAREQRADAVLAAARRSGAHVGRRTAVSIA